MTLWLAVLSAFAGGLILNLMPCVFPVIGLKVLGFAGQDRDDPRAGRRHALVFSAGVLLSFWLLAALLLGLRSAGEAAGWGFQLQSPLFVSAMALLFVAIGLNLAGLFEFGTAASRLGAVPAPHRTGTLSTLGAGLLAVLVATPCTAPFMGSALGFTLGQPLAQVWLVFTALGLGMALPYLLLGWFPAALRWLPRPGRWMETLRQLLAFPMYVTAAWLAWVLGQQAGIDAVFGWSVGAVLLALACWCYGRFVQPPATPRGPQVLAALVAVVALGGAFWVAWPGWSTPVPAAGAASDIGGDWEPWTEKRVQQGRVEGRIVFVDFTAAWCVSCQANKKLVLDREPVAGLMNRLGVLKLDHQVPLVVVGGATPSVVRRPLPDVPSAR